MLRFFQKLFAPFLLDPCLRLRSELRVYCKLLGGELPLLLAQKLVVVRLRGAPAVRVVRYDVRRRQMRVEEFKKELLAARARVVLALCGLKLRLELERGERVELGYGKPRPAPCPRPKLGELL